MNSQNAIISYATPFNAWITIQRQIDPQFYFFDSVQNFIALSDGLGTCKKRKEVIND